MSANANSLTELVLYYVPNETIVEIFSKQWTPIFSIDQLREVLDQGHMLCGFIVTKQARKRWISYEDHTAFG